jgi:hypothetical protein
VDYSRLFVACRQKRFAAFNQITEPLPTMTTMTASTEVLFYAQKVSLLSELGSFLSVNPR